MAKLLKTTEERRKRLQELLSELRETLGRIRVLTINPYALHLLERAENLVNMAVSITAQRNQ